MRRRSRRYSTGFQQIEVKEYSLGEAVDLLKKTATAKFDETVEIAISLGVDPRHADQVVRGTVALPHGLGKEIRVAAVATGNKLDEAKEAGADYAGYEDLMDKICKT